MIDKNKTYRTRDGREVRIYATDGASYYPVHGATLDGDGWCHKTWTEDGQFDRTVKEADTDLIEYDPLLDLKIDDRILVRDVDGETWYKSHFAGISDDGNVETFMDGMTSWSTNRITEWFQWKLPE